MRLGKGGNLGVPTGRLLSITCTWATRPGAGADLSALLLNSAGRVEADEDFVFYNQPSSRGGWVRHNGKRLDPMSMTTDEVLVDTAGLSGAIDRIVFVASFDGSVGVTLASLQPIQAQVRLTDPGPGAPGEPLAEFVVAELSSETAAVMMELHRRGGGWKVRAVGQGYHDGLAGLARDFGVTVDDQSPPDGGTQQAPGQSDSVRAVPSGLPGPPPVDWTRPPVPVGYEL